jgi:hypothetical protein
VYWYLFVCLLLFYWRFLVFVDIDTAFLLLSFSPSRILYLYCTIVCRVPMQSIWREVKSWSRFAWYLRAFFDRATLIPQSFAREDVTYSMGLSIIETQQSPRYTINSYTWT